MNREEVAGQWRCSGPWNDSCKLWLSASAGKNLANPTALLFSGVMMLRHLGMHDIADNIHNAAMSVIAEGTYRTGDLGGSATTSEYTKAIIDKLS
jgi:isocitrate dehydrogenase (NAD+)